MRILIVALLVLPVQDVVEEYESGETRAEYKLNKKGEKHGRYREYFKSGKRKIVANYSRGVPSGLWQEYFEGGKLRLEKSYSRGVIKGLTRYDEDGKMIHKYAVGGSGLILIDPLTGMQIQAHPRRKEQIRKVLAPLRAKIKGDKGLKYDKPYQLYGRINPGRLNRIYVEKGMRRLKAYRWLCGLPIDLQIDNRYAESAQYASAITALNETIDHNPKKPRGMSEDDYARCVDGASNCNLTQNVQDLPQAIDGFMYDSDKANITTVGHRAWLLNPMMKKLGFGDIDGYVAIYATDEGGAHRPTTPIYYPPPGYHPLEYFHHRSVWSIAFYSEKYELPAVEGVKVRVRLLNDEFDLHREIAIDHLSIRDASFGMGPSLLFRPDLEKVEELKDVRIQVSISGIRREGKAFPISYLVHFFQLDKPA